MMTKHMVQRSLTFLALTGILACTGDPTGEFANGVDHLEASPSTFYLVSGSSTSIDVAARDAANNAVEASFQIAEVGPGITVERDLTFEPIRNEDGEFVPNPRPTRVRYIVTATALAASTSFTISAGGKEQEIVSVVTPTNVGTISANTGTVGDEVTITAAAGLRFSAGVGATFGDVPGVVTGVAGDGSSFTVLVPGHTGTGTVSGVEIVGLEGTTIDVPLTDTVEFTSGTDDPTTSPTMPFPAAAGDSVVFYDSYPNDPDQFYTVNIPAGAASYTLSLDWEGDADMDLLGCLSTAPTCASVVGISAGSDHPEVATVNLGGTAGTTGTFRLVAENFDGTAPLWIKITIKKN
jgi:hypothetical protein